MVRADGTLGHAPELRRIHLPRTRVNKVMRGSRRGCKMLRSNGALSHTSNLANPSYCYYLLWDAKVPSNNEPAQRRPSASRRSAGQVDKGCGPPFCGIPDEVASARQADLRGMLVRSPDHSAPGGSTLQKRALRDTGGLTSLGAGGGGGQADVGL